MRRYKYNPVELGRLEYANKIKNSASASQMIREHKVFIENWIARVYQELE